MAEKSVSLEQVLGGLPPVWGEDLLPVIRAEIEREKLSLVALCDEPAVTQTLHDVGVLTRWDAPTVVQELSRQVPLFAVLTDSGGRTDDQAVKIVRQIGANILRAARPINQDFEVISCGGQALSSRIPGELSALAEALELKDAVTVIIPFCRESGTYAVGDVLYRSQSAQLTSARADPSAGQAACDLRRWLKENGGSCWSARRVESLTIHEIRTLGPDEVAGHLADCPPGGLCLVNAADHRDLEVVALAMLKARRQGRRLLCRSAPSFLRVRAGLPVRPLLTAAEVAAPFALAGLLLIGSCTARTAEQLCELLDKTSVSAIELRAERALSPRRRDREIVRIGRLANRAIYNGRDTVVYTTSKPIAAEDPESHRQITGLISQALVEVVRSVIYRPRYILAKGSSTSSDIATRALNVTRAEVLGRILPGVPVWRTGPQSKFPGLSYITFPGNTGPVDGISRIVQDLKSDGETVRSGRG